MKVLSFEIKNATRVIPINGQTTMTIASTGDYVINHSCTGGSQRIRSVTLADTGKAVLSKSPMGLNRTLKITLACEEASKEEFLRQFEMVWQKMVKAADLDDSFETKA